MNSVLKATSLVALTCGLVACGGDTEDNTTSPQNYHDITVDLQGTVFDAVTGQRISTDGLKVTLVQGDNYRTAKTNGDFQGDYFIGNIPASAATLNNITYRIIAEKDGYQTIESTYQPLASVVTDAELLQDRKVAELGNFYMYPNGAAVHDLSVKVFYNGQPVNGATITLQPQTTATTAITNPGAGRTFTQDAGFKAAPVSTTDANGLATFPASSLVLGATYQFKALPIKHNGYDLILTNGATVTAGTYTAGTDASQTTLVMNSVASFADNLYIEDVSNLLSGSVDSNGDLVITLNRRDVTLVGDANLSAALTNATTAALAAGAGAVKATASSTVVAGKTVITVSPVWGTFPVQYDTSNGTTADNNLTITYSGKVLVQIDDKNALYDIFELKGPTGLAVDKTVQVTTAF